MKKLIGHSLFLFFFTICFAADSKNDDIIHKHLQYQIPTNQSSPYLHNPHIDILSQVIGTEDCQVVVIDRPVFVQIALAGCSIGKGRPDQCKKKQADKDKSKVGATRFNHKEINNKSPWATL